VRHQEPRRRALGQAGSSDATHECGDIGKGTWCVGPGPRLRVSPSWSSRPAWLPA
jgi:hypothetical protein